MGFSTGGGQGKPKSDINVTPLVDIVLVMLIIFLVTMPVVLRKIDLEVPKKLDEPVEQLVLPDQVTIEVTKAGLILLNGIQISRSELPIKLHDKLAHKREKVVFVDFDESTRYGDAVHIMDIAKGAGASSVALKMRDEKTATPTPGAAPGTPAPAPVPAPTP